MNFFQPIPSLLLLQGPGTFSLQRTFRRLKFSWVIFLLLLFQTGLLITTVFRAISAVDNF